MPLYDATNRLKTDDCTTATDYAENLRYVEYQCNNHRRACGDQQNRDFALEYKNLIAWDGYGINGCTVDDDSKTKMQLMRGRSKKQLPNRVFHAVPNLYRGTVLPGLESRIQNGLDTTYIRECDKLSEKAWDVFHPAVDRREYMVPNWTWGGDSSRDIARSDGFLQSIGYTHDGRMWRRSETS